MSQVQFSLALGIAFAPAGFALVLIGMCTLAFRPRAKWAIRMVNLGGMMMAALLPAILIGIVTYEILSN